MKNFLQKGQVQLTMATGMVAISFVASPIIAYFSAQAATKEEIASISERAAKLETSVPRMEQDIRDIRDSLKSIEKALRITQQ